MSPLWTPPPVTIVSDNFELAHWPILRPTVYLPASGVVENPAAVARAVELGLTDMNCDDAAKAIPEWCAPLANEPSGQILRGAFLMDSL